MLLLSTKLTSISSTLFKRGTCAIVTSVEILIAGGVLSAHTTCRKVFEKRRSSNSLITMGKKAMLKKSFAPLQKWRKKITNRLFDSVIKKEILTVMMYEK